MDRNLSKISIDSSRSILKAIEQMDNVHHKLLIVEEDGHYSGLVSFGDIQRAIIKGISLKESVSRIIRKKLTIASVHDDREKVKALMWEKRIEYMPVINDAGDVEDVFYWDDFFDVRIDAERPLLDIPVVIMAGGKGTRLKPITNVLPKPLVPVESPEDGNQTYTL